MSDKSDALSTITEIALGKLKLFQRKRSTRRAISRSPTVQGSHTLHGDSRRSDQAFRTRRRGLVAVVTNGTAVLGLGDIGPLAGKPVMESKANLFKKFADIDVFDIELDAQSTDEIVAA